MTETLINDLSSNYEDSILNSNDGNTDQVNIPLVVIDTTRSSPIRTDSVVIPSISNNSISSVIQNETNNTLLPVCTSNSLGKIKEFD